MFIFLSTDSFSQASFTSGAAALETQKGLEGSPEQPIRRPHRGIQIKDDTYAVLSVRGPDGNAIPLISSSQLKSDDEQFIGKVDNYSDFILQRVEDQRMEKNQIIETFGETFVYFFGERPRVVTFSGLLLNTEDFNWRAQFWANYENYFRGSRLVQLNARVFLAYDTLVIEGYPLSAAATDVSDDPYSIPFQMTMLVTNYNEYSTVGAMHFPGVQAEKLDVLNQELAQRSSKFVSTTGAVRAKNLEAQGPGGFFGLVRSGIRSYNSLVGTASRFLDTGKDLLAGRAMRLPPGVAGFLAQTKDAQVGAGSILTTSKVSFDSVTGELNNEVLGVPLDYKIRMAGSSQFAYPWISAVTGTSRGLIYENYDEYPKRDQPSSLEDLISDQGQLEQIGIRQEDRRLHAQIEKESLAKINVIAESGGVLGTIADVVSFVRSSYGMIMTGANLIGDPIGTVSSALGVTPGDFARLGESALRNAVPGGTFIGTGAGRSLLAAANADARFDGSAFALLNPGQTPPHQGAAAIGDVYNSAAYRGTTGAAADINYEGVYGNKDYDTLLAQQAAAEAAEAADEELTEALLEGSTEAIEKALANAYGDTDAPADDSGVDPDALGEVFSLGASVEDNTLTPEERAALIAAAYQNTTVAPTEEDTYGITGAEDDDSEIAPAV